MTPDLLARAAKIRLACFDVDGTLTDGGLYYAGDGIESKRFHVQDGLGLRLLEDHGVTVALITARHGEVTARRAADLKLSHVHVGVADKAATLRALREQLGLRRDEVAHMGDDLPDLPALAEAGFAVAPANAHARVAARVHWVTPARGGHGAARTLCDLILQAQGHDDDASAGPAR